MPAESPIDARITPNQPDARYSGRSQVSSPNPSNPPAILTCASLHHTTEILTTKLILYILSVTMQH